MGVFNRTYRPYFHSVCGHTLIRANEFSYGGVYSSNSGRVCLDLKTLNEPCPNCKSRFKQNCMTGDYFCV